ncbi:MAG: histidine phosphatase family protein [Deltaproteobacteria bacterium]|nr:histidine phosphatase family protein [Deltaproteobacteria bacterium]
MLSIWFLRHGETIYTTTHGMCGSGTDAPLSEAGYEMAEQFGDAYREKNWSAIYCSTMLRARETVAPLLRGAPHVVEYVHDLREIGFGAWEGASERELEKQFPIEIGRWNDDRDASPPPGGERATSVRDRGVNVIESIRASGRDGDILIVSHKATIRIVLSHYLGLPVSQYHRFLGCPVASLSVLQFRSRGPLLAHLGDRNHLSRELQARGDS